MNLLFFFSEESWNIAYCQISEDMIVTENIWKVYDKLPAQGICACFVAFDHFIFLLFSSKSEIWCLDVRYHKFYKLMKKYPYKLSNVCFDPKNNFVHLWDSQINGYHIKINIYNILPLKMKVFYKQKNN